MKVEAMNINYISATLNGECDRVRDAQNGTRNNTLNTAAFTLGTLLALGLDRRQAEADLLDAALSCGLDRGEALSTIKSGLDAGAKQPRDDSAGSPPGRQRARAQGAYDNRERAAGIWQESSPIEGTIAETYLNGRGLVGPYPASLRFNSKTIMGTTSVPAMIAAITDLTTGELLAIQRTALEHDGSGKSRRFSEPKRTLGKMDQGAVVFGDLTGIETIVIAEGVETALSILQATGWTTVAALGSGRLGTLALPATVTGVVVAAEIGSEAAANSAAAQFHRRGMQVWIATPPGDCKDFNDVLTKGGGADVIKQCFETAELYQPQPESDPDEVTPDFSIIERVREPAPRFPIEVLGRLGKDLAAIAQTKSAPVDYVAIALLSACAATVGAARMVSPWPGWEEPARLWAMLVGPPSSSKTPAMSAILKALASLERKLARENENSNAEYEAAKIAAGAAYSEWDTKATKAASNGEPVPPRPKAAVEPDEPPPPRVYMNDATVEMVAKLLSKLPRGLLLFRDELGSLLANFERYNGNDRAFFCETYNGNEYTVDRKGADKSLHARHLLLSILGGIQPDRLHSLLMKGDDDGLAARFLMCWPDPVAPTRPETYADENQLLGILERLRSLDFRQDPVFGPRPIVLGLDEESVAEFQAWREHHAAESVSGMMASAYGKMRGQALSLALVLELVRWAVSEDGTPEPTIVSRRSIGEALDMIEGYFKPMCRRVYGEAALPRSERDAATLGRDILKRRPVLLNARVVRREWRLPGLNEAAAVNAAIDVLVDAGWLISAHSRDGGGPGRKRQDFKVHGDVLRRPS